MAVDRIMPLLGLFIAVMVACGNGGGTADAQRSSPPGTTPKSPGEKVYDLHCVLCHGKDGTYGISGAKDLTISTISREEMIAMVTKGKGGMMPYEKVLTKAEIEAVVEHVLTLQATE